MSEVLFCGLSQVVIANTVAREHDHPCVVSMLVDDIIDEPVYFQWIRALDDLGERFGDVLHLI